MLGKKKREELFRVAHCPIIGLKMNRRGKHFRPNKAQPMVPRIWIIRHSTSDRRLLARSMV
jgi:hypothetical protein